MARICLSSLKKKMRKKGIQGITNFSANFMEHPPSFPKSIKSMPKIDKTVNSLHSEDTKAQNH